MVMAYGYKDLEIHCWYLETRCWTVLVGG